MSDSKVSDLTAHATATTDDEMYIVDISEALAASRSKKVTFAALLNRIVVNNDQIICNNDQIVIL